MHSNTCDNIFLTDVDTNCNFLSNNVAFLTINVRSLRNKFTDLLHLLDTFHSNFLLICLTEVCLDANCDLNFTIPMYNCYKCLRNGHGGGIMVYVHKSIKAEIITDMSGIFQSHESLLIKCNMPSLNEFFLWTIYRPPSLSKPNFFEYLLNNLNFFQNKKVFITGDININLLNNSSPDVLQFSQIMHSFNLSCDINKPTYTSPLNKEPSSCLDHVWHNCQLPIKCFIVYPPFSDHMAVVFSVQIEAALACLNIHFRDYSFGNKTRFLSNVEMECTNYSFTDTTVDSEFLNFTNWFTLLANKYVLGLDNPRVISL